jgi:hypothetical protein
MICAATYLRGDCGIMRSRRDCNQMAAAVLWGHGTQSELNRGRQGQTRIGSLKQSYEHARHA